MTDEEMRALKPGDLVRHKHKSESMVVTCNYGSHVICARTEQISNPCEWELDRRRNEAPLGELPPIVT